MIYRQFSGHVSDVTEFEHQLTSVDSWLQIKQFRVSVIPGNTGNFLKVN